MALTIEYYTLVPHMICAYRRACNVSLPPLNLSLLSFAEGRRDRHHLEEPLRAVAGLPGRPCGRVQIYPGGGGDREEQNSQAPARAEALPSDALSSVRYTRNSPQKPQIRAPPAGTLYALVNGTLIIL